MPGENAAVLCIKTIYSLEKENTRVKLQIMPEKRD
jgi:hypothetical protein